MEGLIEFRTPIVALGLCGELPLLVGEVWPDQVHFYERTEHAACDHPLQVVRSNHWNIQTAGCCLFVLHVSSPKDVLVFGEKRVDNGSLDQ